MQASAQERILDAAYDLFTSNGIGGTGVNDILERSGAAKATLYRIFKSKTELAKAVLARRGEVWTRDWLEAEMKGKSEDAGEQLLAVFDVLDKWFKTKDYEGCLFLKVVHEPNIDEELYKSAVAELDKITGLLQRLASKAGLASPKQFATVWHAHMNGAIVAASAGHTRVSKDTKKAAKLVLENWPRR